ncbi:MAG: DMT family transporter, partial [Bacillota bacterium]|nr:DMT family transporter [Bacillota bacterium]
YAPQSKRQMEYRPWLVRVLLSIVSFGLLGILMKTASYLHLETLDVLVCMYGGGSAYLALISLLKKEKWQRPELKVGTMAGFVSIIGYSSYFYALIKGTASIVFPIVSLNCLIVVIAGCFLFKESLKKYQIAGIISAALGIIFTKI